jgi:hypothetical protein
MSTTRRRALALWLLCTLVIPLLWLMQLLQGVFGSPERSINMAVSLDTCGNALLGGNPRQTISERTGLALIEGKRWARIVAPVIDYFFGPDHCRQEARVWLAKNPGRA